MGRVKVKPESERSSEERAADAARLADMFASRQPPGTKGTDRAFLEGRHNGKQFENEPHVGNRYREIARRAGVSTTGKVYHPGLARRPGDPAAWIDGTGDLLKKCQEQGKHCTGAVEYTPPEKAPPESKVLAEDITQRLMSQTILKNPDIGVRIHNGKQTLADLREDVIAKHSFKRKPTHRKVAPE